MKLSSREYFLCCLLFVLSPILTILKVPGHLAIGSLLWILVCVSYMLSYSVFRKILISWPLLVWLALTLYHNISAMTKHIPGVDIIDLLHGLKIYSCIAIFSFWGLSDLVKTSKYLVVSYHLYALILMISSGFNEANRLDGLVTSSTGIGQESALLGVMLALYVLFSKRSFISFSYLFIFPLAIILLTQSRNSLAMLAMSFLLAFAGYRYKNGKTVSFQTIMFFLIAGLILYIAMPYFMDSGMAQRFSESSDFKNSYQFREYSTGTFFDTIVGDRLIYYIAGWDLFMDSPITGIGMWGFQPIFGGDYPLHSEYMIHLCEGGIIAASLWGMFVFGVVRGVFTASVPIYLKIVVIGGIGIILFCGIYAREFYTEIFYPLYGIAISLGFHGSAQTVGRKGSCVRTTTNLQNEKLYDGVA